MNLTRDNREKRYRSITLQYPSLLKKLIVISQIGTNLCSCFHSLTSYVDECGKAEAVAHNSGKKSGAANFEAD